jgi:hypothetical protein
MVSRSSTELEILGIPCNYYGWLEMPINQIFTYNNILETSKITGVSLKKNYPTKAMVILNNMTFTLTNRKSLFRSKPRSVYDPLMCFNMCTMQCTISNKHCIVISYKEETNIRFYVIQIKNARSKARFLKHIQHAMTILNPRSGVHRPLSEPLNSGGNSPPPPYVEVWQ